MTRKLMTGNVASAWGARLAKVEVVSAYPITPQTTVVETIAEFVAKGEMKTQFIKVESEQSAIASLLTASNLGARTFTATSSQGLLLMHEHLMWASGARLPIIMTNVNRAVAPPWSVWADHLDTIAQRDTGWMQIFCEGNQEVLDTCLMAYKIAEREHIRLPMMIVLDAFILSHTFEPVEIPEQEAVDAWLPPYDPKEKLEPGVARGFGSLVMPENYMEFRYNISQAMDAARGEIVKVAEDFKATFGRYHGDLLDLYRSEDAEVLLLVAGSVASTARESIDQLREQGLKVGMARIRSFRPFPGDELRALAAHTKVFAVLDRAMAFGYRGPMYTEVAGALYPDRPDTVLKNYIGGLGGRDMTPDTISGIFRDALELVDAEVVEHEIEWVDLVKPEVLR